MSMTLIAHTELGSAQATIEFTSIPATFTDLQLVVSARADSSTSAIFRVSFNGVTTNLSDRKLTGAGSGTPSSGTSSNIEPVITPSDATSGVFGSSLIYIANYSGTNAKSISVDSVTENNATTAYQRLVAGLFNTSSAITSIQLNNPSGNFAQYSSATLYGITAGSSGGVVVS